MESAPFRNVVEHETRRENTEAAGQFALYTFVVRRSSPSPRATLVFSTHLAQSSKLRARSTGCPMNAQGTNAHPYACARREPAVFVHGGARARESELFFELAQEALTDPDLERFLHKALERAAAALGADAAEILRYSEKPAVLSRSAATGFQDSQFTPPSLDVAQLPGVLFLGPGDALESAPLPPYAAAENAKFGLWVPLSTAAKAYGLLGLYWKVKGPFSEAEPALALKVARVFASAIERRHREDELAREREQSVLRRSAQALDRAQRLASLGTFTAGIAHELNNPLTSILLGAESGMRTTDTARVQKALTTILHNAERCRLIMDSVLKFMREEESPRWLVDLNHLIERVACLAQNELPARRLKLKFDLDPGLTPVFANPTELEQAFINILRNAVQAKNGRTCRVSIRTENAGKRVRLRIADDGPGIPLEHLTAIFDPFFSTQRKSGGAGLGLSITQRILSAHGGTIHALNQTSGGACFVIELPAARS